VNHRILAIVLLLPVAGCMPFPRYAYSTETRVGPASGSTGLSAGEQQAARNAAVELVREIGMEPRVDRPETTEAEQQTSATKSPPRKFVRVYWGRAGVRVALILRVELGVDPPVLYFTLIDPNQGTPSTTFERIDALLEARIQASVPELRVTREVKIIGPIWSLPP
jgi:hypothetical protein